MIAARRRKAWLVAMAVRSGSRAGSASSKNVSVAEKLCDSFSMIFGGLQTTSPGHLLSDKMGPNPTSMPDWLRAAKHASLPPRPEINLPSPRRTAEHRREVVLPREFDNLLRELSLSLLLVGLIELR